MNVCLFIHGLANVRKVQGDDGLYSAQMPSIRVEINMKMLGMAMALHVCVGIVCIVG